MRILGLAGLLLGLALMGYLVVSYLHEGTAVQETLRGSGGSSGAGETARPIDVTKRGLEERLAPSLDKERQRVEETNRTADQ